MKKHPGIRFMSYLVMTVFLLATGCKKDEPKPAPTLNTDNYDMGADATAIVDVLANDVYKGTAILNARISSDYGTVSITSDNKVLYTPVTNYYGIVPITYTVKDDNWNSSGSLLIKRGTDEQINTYTLISTYNSFQWLWMYSVDGDSSRIYQGPDYNENHLTHEKDHFNIWSAGEEIMPHTGRYTYTISSDGSLLTYADDGEHLVVLTNFEAFTDPQAKKRDGSGTMSVSGYSFYYGTKKLIYTTRID